MILGRKLYPKYLILIAIKTSIISILLFSASFSIADDSLLYNKLIKEIRCMVCQNQNISESEAPLAVDLRNKVKEMIAEGKSEIEIKEFMTKRYSSFILYEPPKTWQNLILWLGPFVFLIILSLFLYRKSQSK